MEELHEVDLTTFEDNVVDVDIKYRIEAHRRIYDILRPKFYHYIVKIYGYNGSWL